jgi:hypothetical protein
MVLSFSCLLLAGCPQKASSPAPATTAATTSSAAPTTAAPAKPADTGGTTAVESFWKSVGVGTVAQYAIVNDIQKPMKMETKTTQTKTLSSKDDKGYVLKVAVTANGTALPPQEEKGDWLAPAGGGASSATPPKDLGSEKVKVGAGEFDCKHMQTTSTVAGAATTTDSWTFKSLLVKMTSKSDSMTMSMELTKLDKK